jgi:hypothetical protein
MRHDLHARVGLHYLAGVADMVDVRVAVDQRDDGRTRGYLLEGSRLLLTSRALFLPWIIGRVAPAQLCHCGH